MINILKPHITREIKSLWQSARSRILLLIPIALVGFLYDKLLFYISLIPQGIQHKTILTTLVLVCFLVPYSIVLKISSIKDEQYMIKKCKETRKQAEISGKIFTEARDGVLIKKGLLNPKKK